MRFMSIDLRRVVKPRVRVYAFVALVCAACAFTSSDVRASEAYFAELSGQAAPQTAGAFGQYLTEYAPAFEENEEAEEESQKVEPISLEKFASLDSLAPSGLSDAAQELAQLGELDEGFAERGETGRSDSSQVYYNGSSVYLSHDAIVRGSVNLPSIKSIQFWGNGYVGSGHVSPVNWNGRVNEHNSGGVLGVNLPLGVGTISGFYNYHRNRAKYYRRCIQQEDDGCGMAFYANVGGFYVTALGMYGDDGYAASDLNGQRQRAFISGCQTTGFFETGYEMQTLGMFVLKPFGSYQYTTLQHGNFNTSTLVKRAGKRKYNSCLMTLGSRVDLNLAGLDVFTLEGRMAWVTQLRSKNESIHSFNYGRVPGTVSLSQPYFQGSGAGSDLFWGGVGLRLSLLGMLSVSADYDCLVNKYQTTNEGSLGLLFGF